MVSSPIVVLIELVTGIIRLTIEEIKFIFSKLFEFFYSITIATGNVTLALIVAGLVGCLIFLLIRRRLFGSFWTIIVCGIIFLLLISITALILSFHPSLIVSG